METNSKNIRESRAIEEILPADVAYYQKPIELGTKETMETLRDLETTWDSDISAFMWDMVGVTDAHFLDRHLHHLWQIVIKLAKNTHFDDSKQDSLVRWILSIREMGVLTDPKNTSVVAKASNGQRLWVDLPYLADEVRKSWIIHLSMTVEQRANFASFIARLVSVGVCSNALAVCGLLLFRDTFEIPRQLKKTDSGLLESKDISVEELLPAVRSWTDYASFKLVSLTLKSFNEYSAEDSDLGQLIEDRSITHGFSSYRWDFWKKRLVQFIEVGYEPVASEAAEIIRQMAVEGYSPL